MASRKLVVIGLGGIGTSFCDNACRYLNFQKNNNWTLHLVDGDNYEIKNQERQSFIRLGNKASVKSTELRMKFDNIIFYDTTEYITSSNIDSVIVEDDIVFLCVDNHATRKLVSEHIEKLNNVVLISGGNEKTDGNVQVTVKKGGVFKTANLTDYHPEIREPQDRSPHEMSCEELSMAEPQIFFTNMTVATIMCWILYALDKDSLDIDTIGELYFDILKMSVVSYTRKPLN